MDQLFGGFAVLGVLIIAMPLALILLGLAIVFNGRREDDPTGMRTTAVEFGSADPNDKVIRDTIQAGLIVVPALLVFLFHWRRREAFVAEPGFAESPGFRVDRIYLFFWHWRLASGETELWKRLRGDSGPPPADAAPPPPPGAGSSTPPPPAVPGTSG